MVAPVLSTSTGVARAVLGSNPRDWVPSFQKPSGI